MTSTKYIGMDVHKESISIAVMNAAGKIVMECVIETKASMILQCIDGLRGDLHVTFKQQKYFCADNNPSFQTCTSWKPEVSHLLHWKSMLWLWTLLRVAFLRVALASGSRTIARRPAQGAANCRFHR